MCQNRPSRGRFSPSLGTSWSSAARGAQPSPISPSSTWPSSVGVDHRQGTTLSLSPSSRSIPLSGLELRLSGGVLANRSGRRCGATVAGPFSLLLDLSLSLSWVVKGGFGGLVEAEARGFSPSPFSILFPFCFGCLITHSTKIASPNSISYSKPNR